MAQPRADGRRLGFSGGHFEEFRRQSGAGRRRETGCRGRRVRPVVPAAVSRRGGGHLGRRRPPRHLRDARGGEGGLLAVRAADPAGRLAHHQAGRRHRDRQPRDRRIPLFLRRAVRFLRPQRAAARRGALPLRPGDTLGRVRGVHAGRSGVGQHRKRGRGRRFGVVRREGRRNSAGCR